jgi:hypothetical protein
MLPLLQMLRAVNVCFFFFNDVWNSISVGDTDKFLEIWIDDACDTITNDSTFEIL